MIARMRFFILICALSLPILVCPQGLTTARIDQALVSSRHKAGDVFSGPTTTPW